MHEIDRRGWHFDGGGPGPAHPFVEALRTATDLEALASEHGQMSGFWVREDEIIRGLFSVRHFLSYYERLYLSMNTL
jgi:hypothetical protein